MESQNLDIKSFLLDKGCKIQQSGGEIQIVATWRGGKNFSVSVNPRNGNFFDFVEASGGNFDKLNQLLGGEARDENFSFSNTDWVDELTLPKTFDKNILNNLIKDYSYWENRGISRAVLEEFGGGLAGQNLPKFNKDHYLTPIFNEKRGLDGFSARYTGNNPKVKKQKIIGSKKNFKYPLFLNKDLILKTKTVYLVEGVADLYTNFTCGFRNTLCFFGLYLSPAFLSTLISLNPAQIIICENNDELKQLGGRMGRPGQEGAAKIKKSLLNFFDENVIKIRNPAPYKDLNEMLVKSGEQSIVDLLK